MADHDTAPSSSDDGQADTNNTTLYAALIIVGLVLLLAIWVIWPRSDSDPSDADSDALAERPAPGTDDTPMEEGELEAGERAGDCPEGMPEGDEIPETAPEVDWQVHWTVALPFSEEHGPAVVDGDIARCYSHTPTGALIASDQIGYRTTLAPDRVEVVRAQTVPGPGQDRRLELLEDYAGGEAQPGQMCQIAGFRFVTYSPEEAVIASASRCPGGNLQLLEVRLRWVDGDWKVVLEDDGSSSPTASALVDLDGMVTWGGV